MWGAVGLCMGKGGGGAVGHTEGEGMVGSRTLRKGIYTWIGVSTFLNPIIHKSFQYQYQL